MNKTLKTLCFILLATIYFAASTIAEPTIAEPKVVKSGMQTGDGPSKGSIKLDLQVDEDSSVFTKTVMVELENLNAEEVKPFVKKGLSKYGSVSVNASANLLVITDREPKLTDIVNFVYEMDKLGIDNFVQLKTEVIKLDNAQASSLVGIVSPRLTQDGSIHADNNLNVLVVTDVAGKIKYVKDIIRQLDQPPQQVIIEARIVQLFDADFSDVGIDLSALLSGGRMTFNYATQNSDQMSGGSNYENSSKSKTKAYQSQFNVEEVIGVLTGTNRAKLAASPRFVTLNNKTGQIGVDISMYSGSDRTTRNTQLYLYATPRIGAGNTITIDFSAASGDMSLPYTNAANISIPAELSNKRISSSVVLKEGETFVVGGLETKFKTFLERRTPLLGHIPVLEKAFTKKTEYERTSNILFFLTPRIIKNADNPPTDKEKLLME